MIEDAIARDSQGHEKVRKKTSPKEVGKEMILRKELRWIVWHELIDNGCSQDIVSRVALNESKTG